jgi:hypothetical protein
MPTGWRKGECVNEEEAIWYKGLPGKWDSHSDRIPLGIFISLFNCFERFIRPLDVPCMKLHFFPRHQPPVVYSRLKSSIVVIEMRFSSIAT